MAHALIIGSTGSGKSTLAKQLTHSALNRGCGLLYLDKHGPDATALVETIPKKRWKDTILLDPYEFPLKWNPLDVHPRYHYLVAKAFISTVRSTASMPGAPTANMDMTVHSSILALLGYGGTLLDVQRLFTDNEFRYQVTDTVLNSAGKEHWKWFESLDPRRQQEIIGSTYNKFYQFAADEPLARVFESSETKLDMFDVLHNNRVLIARLPVGQLGEENVKLLGNMLLSLAQVAAMSRTTTTPFLIVADECHTWAPDLLQEMLTGIRKFNVQLICINQFTSQLTDELFDALKGNAESYVFRVSPDDARRFQRWFPKNAMPENLEDLPDFTYRKFPWREGDKDVTVARFDVSPTGSRAYIEANMKWNYM